MRKIKNIFKQKFLLQNQQEIYVLKRFVFL